MVSKTFNARANLAIDRDEKHDKIAGWRVLNREIVSFRSCARTRGLVA